MKDLSDKATIPTISLLLSLVCAVALAACGGDETAASPPTNQSSTSTPVDAEQSPSEPADPTETTPTVAPATGKVIKVRGLSVRVPEGWTPNIRLTIQQGAFPTDRIGTIMRVFRFPNSDLFTIDELADEEVGSFGPRGKRVDDLFMDGQKIYHLVGNPHRGSHTERFGTIIANGDQVFVEFEFGNGETRTERDEIIQSVLATAQFG